MIRKFIAAFSGLRFALTKDKGFRTQLLCSLGGLALVTYLAHPLSTTEAFMLGFAMILILITELQNSALETALDRVHPERHEAIRDSKDMAAASVLLAVLFAVGVGLFVIFT